MRFTLALAAILGATGVAMGAFGAHGLRDKLSEPMLRVYQTAVQYQLWHAVALLALAAWQAQRPSPAAAVAFWAWVLGVIIFSGSLYILSLSEVRWWGAITPIGGVLLIGGWVAVLVAALGRAA